MKSKACPRWLPILLLLLQPAPVPAAEPDPPPGKTVRVEAPCLDCGLAIRVDIKDGVLLRVEPEGVTGFVAVPMWKWYENLPYS